MNYGTNFEWWWSWPGCSSLLFTTKNWWNSFWLAPTTVGTTTTKSASASFSPDEWTLSIRGWIFLFGLSVSQYLTEYFVDGQTSQHYIIGRILCLSLSAPTSTTYLSLFLLILKSLSINAQAGNRHDSGIKQTSTIIFDHTPSSRGPHLVKEPSTCFACFAVRQTENTLPWAPRQACWKDFWNAFRRCCLLKITAGAT